MSDKPKSISKKKILTFLGKTVENYLNDAKNVKQYTWVKKFKEINFDDVAKKTYLEVFGEIPSLKKSDSMYEHIKNNMGDEYAVKYDILRNFDYEPKHTTQKEKVIEILAKNAVSLLTRDNENYTNTTITDAKIFLTDFYNKINGTVFSFFSGKDGVENDMATYSAKQKALQEQAEANEADKQKALQKQAEANEADKQKALQEQQAEHNKKINETAAQVKHNTEERVRKEMANKNDVSSDDESDEQVVDPDEKEAVKEKGKQYAEDIEKAFNMERIINKAAIDNDFFNQLPKEIQNAIRGRVEEKRTFLNRAKIIKYILPKERPRWERGTINNGVNPMLGRSAWHV